MLEQGLPAMGGTRTASKRCKRQERPPCRGADPSHGSEGAGGKRQLRGWVMAWLLEK